MSTLKNEIYSFVSSLPELQKILAAHLLQLTEQELKKDDAIQFSLEALLVENKLTTTPETAVKYTIREKSDGAAASSASKFFLSSISNVQNLNALSSGQTLSVWKVSRLCQAFGPIRDLKIDLESLGTLDLSQENR